MKEVVKASISGIAFTFDSDAYEVMDDYLKKIEAWYSKYPDGREIAADIEARVAELILEHQESDKVVGLPLVEDIVSQLGYPDDMASGEGETLAGQFPRRLYRNPDGAKLGGICSGLGAFFKIDPVWIRLGIFAPLVLGVLVSALSPNFGFHNPGNFWFSLFGFVVLLYFVLWIAVPKAKNPRQKLEMRGERVTADSIRQEFEGDFSARPAYDSAKSRRNASVWADLTYVVGRIMLIFFKIILFFIAFGIGMALLSILAVIVAFALGTTLNIGGHLGLLPPLDGMAGIGPNGFAVIWLFVVFIPLLLLFIGMIKVIAGSRRSWRPFFVTSWVIWLILFIWGVALAWRNADVLRDREWWIENGGLEQWLDNLDERLEELDDRHYWFDYDSNSDDDRWKDDWNNDRYYDREMTDSVSNTKTDSLSGIALRQADSLTGDRPDGTLSPDSLNIAGTGAPAGTIVAQSGSRLRDPANGGEETEIGGSGSERIHRTGGGPIVIEKNNGRQEIIEE